MQKPSQWAQKGFLRYVTGDATLPVGGSLKYILQVCNNEGKYGAGFSGAIARKWPRVESDYRSLWRQNQGYLKLGTIQEIFCQTDVRVINMIAQDGILTPNRTDIPLRYDALEECLSKTGILISDEKGAAHMPRIGAGLAGGDWNKIEKLIEEQLLKRSINVTVYDLPKS